MFSSINKSRLSKEAVKPEVARDAIHLAVRQAQVGEVFGFKEWRGAVIGSEVQVIHDLNGQVLFYEFEVRDKEQVVAVVKASATELIGSPVVTVELGPRSWTPAMAIKRVTEEARRRYPKAKLSEPELVCYCYPKLGVRVTVAVGDTQRGIIADVADGRIIDRFGRDELEGSTAYSFLEEVAEPQRDMRLRRFAYAREEMELIRRQAPMLFEGLPLERIDDIRVRLFPKDRLILDAIRLYSSRVIKYGPRCSPHDCFQLYAQQTDVYYAVATAQMILDFHRWNFTQDQIATAMNTGATGTSNPDQVTGYESLTGNALDATFDGTADWSEAKAEIDANRPLKSGISGHARACAGWKRQNFSFVGQPLKRWLLIYDPWPWNANLCDGGKVVWEDWDAVSHTNFIYVRH